MSSNGMELFQNSLGSFSFVLNDKEYNVKPQMGDKMKLLKIVKKNQTGESAEGTPKFDEVNLLDDMIPFIADLLSRSYPEIDKDTIGLFVEDNFEKIITEIFIGFKLADKSKLDKIKN